MNLFPARPQLKRDSLGRTTTGPFISRPYCQSGRNDPSYRAAMMERLSFVLLVLLAGCALQSRPQTGDRSVVVGAITEQQSHTTALLQAVSAVDDSVVGSRGTRQPGPGPLTAAAP